MVDISKIDMDRIEGLIEKLNSMKYVVETWSEGTEWYRVWSDGWIEQGGRCNAVAYNNGTKNVTFHKAMKDTNYFAVASPITNASNDRTWSISTRVAGLTTTQMTVRGGKNADGAWLEPCTWYVCGY